MKANQNRRAWLWLLAVCGLARPVRAQNAPHELAARTREWRLDGTIVGLDAKRGVLRLQPDVLVMRAEGDAVSLGKARETTTRLIATRLIATDNATQMRTPDGQLRPLQFDALRNAAQIIVIGPLQNGGEETVLRARLIVLRQGLPADNRAPQVLAPTVSRPAERPQVLAPPLVNRAPQNADARRAATETTNAAPPSYAPDAVKRAALRRDDWTRRVPPPTLSLAPDARDATNAPQVLAPSISTARPVAAQNRASENRASENRLVAPSASERVGPPQPARLSANLDLPEPTAPLTHFPRAEIIADAPTINAPALHALPPTSAPRTTGRATGGAAGRPALSLDETSLRARGALASIAAPVMIAPGAQDGRASLRLDDAQSLVQQQQTAILARANYAQLRGAQNAVAWPTFSNGVRNEKLVALTFDDGPHPTVTPAILEQLQRFGVPATFFVVGRNVEKYPELLQREAAAGHDIGSHSWHHFQGLQLSAEQWHQEIAGNNRIIENVLGVAPRWFRAPGCHYSREALNALHNLQMVRADSSNNSGDWEGGAPDQTVARVLNRLAPGQVLLFHDSVPQTAQALPILLRELKARGYRCVTLTELAQRAAQVPGFTPDFHPVGQGIVLPPNALATW